MQKISDYSKDCELCKMNLTTMTEQYNKSVEDSKKHDTIIGDPTVFAASLVAVFVTGLVVGIKAR